MKEIQYGSCEFCGSPTIHSKELGESCPHCFLEKLKKAKKKKGYLYK